MSTAAHITLGIQGEEAALALLTRQGARLLARNWRPQGKRAGIELDMVVKERDTLVFVEVKTRSFSSGSEVYIPIHTAFTPQKQKKLLCAAQLYLTECNMWAAPCRFDLICVACGPKGPEHMTLEHHKNVIELGQTLDSRHSSWQPW